MAFGQHRATPRPASAAPSRPGSRTGQRQLATSSSQPPNKGANSGDTDRISSIWAKMRAASPGGKISRTQARASTVPAQPPLACDKAGDVQGQRALRQGAGQRAQDIEHHARSAAASGGRSGRTAGPTTAWPIARAPENRTPGNVPPPRSASWNSRRDGGQGRHVHVHGDGGEDGQHPEQDDQFETPRAGDLGAERGMGMTLTTGAWGRAAAGTQGLEALCCMDG